MLLNNDHRFTKKIGFFFEVCDERILKKNKRYARNFLLFKKVLHVDQYVLGLKRRSADLLNN